MQIHVLSFVEGEMPPIIEVPLSTMRTIADSLNRTSLMVASLRAELEKLCSNVRYEDVDAVAFNRAEFHRFRNLVMGK